MHHPGVVNNTKEVFLSARVVSWGIIISVVGIDISGCTRHFDFYYNKNGLSHALTNRHTWRFFLFLYQIKKHVNSGKLVGQEPWVAICERGGDVACLLDLDRGTKSMKNNKYLPPFGGVLILVSIINGLNFQINNNFR